VVSLSISSVSVAINPRQASLSDEGWAQFAQLVRAVNAGDLAASQKAYDKFTQSPAAEVAQSNPNGRIAQAIGKIGDALQAGDISIAQKALAALRPRNDAANTPTVTAPSISPPDPNAPGSKLNVIV
jgi:hypothetical protein